VIDTHAHFFNSSDVHVKHLLSPTLSKGEAYEGAARSFATWVRDFAWTIAPGAQKERKVMAQIRQVLSQCAKSRSTLDGRASSLVDGARQEAYDTARKEILSFIGQRRAQRQFAPVLEFAVNLPRDANAYFFGDIDRSGLRTRRGVEILGRSGSNFVEFIIRQLQYRCVNYFDYLRYMSTRTDNAVDLAIYHLLDFDYPLGGGKPTPTSVPEQVKLLSELTVLSQGRVHGFVPFDPMKAVMHRTGLSPLDIVKDAVGNKGFIGVKIYPPMGFAPLGNARKPDSFWRDGRWWLPQELRRMPHFGKRLDEELIKLYDWCKNHDVPIMGHTNVSIGPTPEFEALVDASYWEELIDAEPGLRINFGHFGNTEPANRLEKTFKFMDLMRKDPNSKTKFLYADSSYFVEGLNAQVKFERALKKLQRRYGSTRPGLFDRFMFGTDWNMVTLVSSSANYYLSAFEKVMDAAAPNQEAKNNFFGRNAAAYLGLTRGEQTRRRLERFYFRHSIATPDWMRKVDQIA
jgi:predicted TIM-barrel fold metal-dependent hydrolase